MNEPTPLAFLCHATEDKSLVENLARELRRHGIDTFFDKWEIRAGDSIRQKVDEGIAGCTHFIVVLSEASLTKPWVNAELDAAFVARLANQLRLIPLRVNLAPSRLPPLLRGLYSPSLDDADNGVKGLIADILGLTDRPPLGERPAATRPVLPARLGLSPLATIIARTLVLASRTARDGDPQLPPERLRELTDQSDEDILEAIDELESRRWVRVARVLAGGMGFAYVAPRGRMFAELDAELMPWDPLEDARTIAAEIVNVPGSAAVVSVLDRELGWGPRRVNPAITVLVEHGVMDHSNTIDPDYEYYSLHANVRTRRFLRQ